MNNSGGGVQISLNTGTIPLLFELPSAGVGTAGVGTAGVAVGTLLIEIIAVKLDQHS